MRKKVKRIPKYNGGTPYSTAEIDAIANQIKEQMGLLGTGGGLSGTIGGGGTDGGSNYNSPWKNMDTNQKISTGIEALGTVGSLLNTATSGQDVTVGGAISATASGAAMGAQFGGPIGAIVGAGVGLAAGTAGRKRGVDYTTGTADMGSGWMKMFGPSKDHVLYKANMAQNSIQSRQQTENLKADYMNRYGGAVKVAEGGIMRRPVDALVSKGELIYDPTTLKLRQVPGSKGKPNKADDVYAKLYEGDVVISNSPTMLMANGKTPAQNLMGMVDKYATGGTVKAREAIIKKVVNWQEANKTKPQEYAKFSEGIEGVNKYGYNKNMSEFAYWDKDKNEYKKEYLDWVKNLTEQDVRDIEAGKYGDMSEYFSKNKGKKLDVATAQKLMTDKKYGNWHKIGLAVVDKKIANAEPKLAEPWHAKRTIKGLGPTWQDRWGKGGNYPFDYTVVPIDLPDLKTLPNPSAADGSRAARKYLAKQNKSNWLNNIGGLLPVIGGLFDKYDYHTEEALISPAKYIPVNTNIDPLRRAADESYAMARYNQSNISPNTGAGMAYGLQAASNRAKQYADAYQWQQETNNKLIAQNAGIYNDWRKQRDAYVTQAIADTRANEGAAQQMRDQARKDRLEFYYGNRNDKMKLAALDPLLKYAFDDNTYKKIYNSVV